MTLLITPGKCPSCGEQAYINSSCRTCGYVDPEYEEWIRTEINKYSGPLKDYMIVYSPRQTIYRRKNKFKLINTIIDWLDRNIHRRRVK